MIEQQYYTRERRGIFRPSEGYDTIAKSEGLSENFIKKYLHPFCFYDPPRALEISGEKDPSKYPEGYYCFQVETGELVLGRSVYVSSDFTGLRSTFFAHNFVIPKDEKMKYIENADNMAFARGFVSCYDIEKGKKIPELSEVDYDRYDLSDGAGTLSELGVTSEIYKKLLYAAIMASSDRKKVYINPGADISSISDYARVLLKYVLGGLPYDVRENTGFLTYCREIESRKYINIMFVEDEGLKAGYSKIEREYVFDIGRSRISNVDINVESHPYFNFAWECINNTSRMESFYRFAGSLLRDAKQDVRLCIDTYDELCVLYRAEEGDSELYMRDRERIFESVLKYYGTSDEGGKERLCRLYLKNIDRETQDINSSVYLPSSGMIESLVNFFTLDVQKVNGKIFYLLQYALLRARNKSDYISKVFGIISQNTPMYVQFVDMVLKSNSIRPVFESYINERFSEVNSIEGLFTGIKYWGGISEVIFSNSFIRRLAGDKTIELLGKSRNLISDGKRVDNFFSGLGEEAKDFSKSILKDAEEYVYRNIDLDRVALEDIDNLNLRVRRNESKFIMLEYIYELVKNGPTFDMDNIFGTDNGDKVKKLIRRLYKDDIEYRNYSRIIQGFKNISSKGDVTYDFYGLLEYMKTGGTEEVYEFLLWSFDENVFSNTSNFPEYKDNIKDYFSSYDRSAFKKRETRKKMYGTQSRVLTKLLKEIELDLSNPVVKFLTLHKRQVVLGLLTVASAVIVTFVGLKIYDALSQGHKVIDPPVTASGVQDLDIRHATP